uniref:ATP synthase F0 subunit 6 n=1 Tax=Trichinella spiralis TaxID=6334 RepID=Q9B8A7_TRISP|nr:ATP synthase F0 subunit 6 [Trichinella spiralis]AAK12901.1 ATP synthase F0 subunit 6 [Trichinella spiralis]ADB78098.1 ATP synthase F0 subunit 6 [Trichinella spiralis]ADD60484.1 ATP synthase F0 subunit 6 [Trichinella spiralis]ADD60487.1 ATP synthase F0 subunit 6 [Trichinella spiralis]ADD60490.1 ATP synthase F0 subunit 6 [Trichinella spiralis]
MTLLITLLTMFTLTKAKPSYELSMNNNYMAMSGLDSSNPIPLTSTLSILLIILAILLMPIDTFWKTRWYNTMKKLTNSNLNNQNNSYTMTSNMLHIMMLSNLISLLSYNWIINSQWWTISLMTTLYLLSLWSSMLLNSGLKTFGKNTPLGWMMINMSLWMFHNMSYAIRFVSLPFRMMMNLIVGVFLTEFAKSNIMSTTLISLYEIFVMLVQTTVFIILANMYYSEMTMSPEWMTHTKTHKSLKKPTQNYITLTKNTLIMMMFIHKMNTPKPTLYE